jgi:hypothetical protein
MPKLPSPKMVEAPIIHKKQIHAIPPKCDNVIRKIQIHMS